MNQSSLLARFESGPNLAILSLVAAHQTADMLSWGFQTVHVLYSGMTECDAQGGLS